MFESVYTWALPLSFWLYWAPLALCFVGFAMRLTREIRRDYAYRDERHYTPNVTIGTVIGYSLVSAAPIANLFAAVFSVGPELFGGVFRFIGSVFDMPLVPRRTITQ